MPLRRRRGPIGYGTWGSNLFQSLYDRTPSTLGTLPMMPEWYLLIGLLVALSIAGIFYGPLVPWTSGSPVRIELLLLGAAALALAAKAIRSAWHAPKVPPAGGPGVRALTAVLFLLQPFARLTGRMRGGLTPWRRRGELVFVFPWPRRRTVWSERWRSQTDRLLELERDLRTRCMTAARGGDTDRWDMEVRLGPLASARVRMAVEEHGQGRQLVRYHVWPRWSRAVPVVGVLLAVWLVGAIGENSYLAVVACFVLVLVFLRAFQEAGAGVALVLRAIGAEVETPEPAPDAPELLDELHVPHAAVNGWNGSHVHVSRMGEVRDRGR
jgi:hypothetical protein